MPKCVPPQQELRKLFDYDSTGLLLWRVSPSRAIKAGATAGYVKCAGRERRRRHSIEISGSAFYRARLVWVWHNGRVPDGFDVDHVNSDALDDRIENLRLATRSQNMMNVGARKSNKSGLKGVFWDRNAKKWKASARLAGLIHRLGSFDSPEAAHAAYCAFASMHHGDFARTS